MKKKLSVLLICSVALVSILLTPTLIADASRRHDRPRARFASGTWEYTPGVKDFRYGDSYTFILGDEDGTWTGTFTGTSYDVFSAVIQPSGIVYLHYGLIFFEGTVDGKEGTLIISFAPGENIGGEWSGEWEILSGTDDLENLRGHGTWWGPSKDLEYSGKIYFRQPKYDDDDD